jgi:hypothetical protein
VCLNPTADCLSGKKANDVMVDSTRDATICDVTQTGLLARRTVDADDPRAPLRDPHRVKRYAS